MQVYKGQLKFNNILVSTCSSLHEASKSGLEQFGATKIRNVKFRDGYVLMAQRTDSPKGRLLVEEVSDVRGVLE